MRATPQAVGRVLGLDIGGANLKVATCAGHARSVPFALWRHPGALPQQLRRLLRPFRHERIALTMTGELCDCFASQREGVEAILSSIREAAPTIPILVWSTQGRLVSLNAARCDPSRVAAGNWHALATFAGRFAPEGAAILIDVGSTTTDIIPLQQGRPNPRGWTDPERLVSGELVYTGIRRTPVCAVLSTGVAAEFFATMHDVYVVLMKLPEEPENRDTADGRPATREGARARLARMVCADPEHFSMNQAVRLGREARRWQVHAVAQAIQTVAGELPDPLPRVIVSGSGEFLARDALRATPKPRGYRVISLAKKLSPAVSVAACAYALAVLAEERSSEPEA